MDVLDLWRIWQLGGFGCVENTPKGCADDYPTILGIYKNDPNSRSVNNCLKQLDFDPNNRTYLLASQRSAQ